jgi:uncharacterized OsmC-like protein
MKLLVESAGKVASRVRLGAHELLFDQPASVRGGADRGPSPLDVLIASVAACAHYYASAFLFGRGLATDKVAIEAEAEKESVPAPRISRLSMTVRVPDGLSSQQLEGIERAIKRCPAYNTLVRSPVVELKLEVVRDSTSATMSVGEHASA